jgi:hypothetical protein
MQFFALQTDIDRLKARFLVPGEQEIFTVRRHGVSFLLHLLRPLLVTLLLLAAAVALGVYGVLIPLWAIVVFLAAWFLLAFNGFLNAFINWRYDFLFLTTNKLVIVDQQSIIRNAVRSINLEEISVVVAETQWLNLFSFGKLHITMRRGEGEPETVISFMPHPDTLAGSIMGQINRVEHVPQ